MDQITVGRFIMQKRKEKNMTQEQLAEKIGVSNKTVSKWETGKCMPDYSVIELLCKELNTTLAELMSGETDEKSIHTYDNEQIVKMLGEMQRLKNTKTLIIGFLLIIMGGVMLALSQLFRGTEIQDFLSGFMLGISISEMLIIWHTEMKRIEVFAQETKTGHIRYRSYVCNYRDCCSAVLHHTKKPPDICRCPAGF